VESARGAALTLWRHQRPLHQRLAWLVSRLMFVFVVLLFGALLRSVPLLGFGAFVLIVVLAQFWWKRRR
jgi:hypothetical protein